MAGVISSIGKAIGGAVSAVGKLVSAISNSVVGKLVRAVVAIPLILPVAVTLGIASITFNWMDKCWSEVINRTGLRKELLYDPFLHEWSETMNQAFWGWLKWCSAPYVDSMSYISQKSGSFYAERGDEPNAAFHEAKATLYASPETAIKKQNPQTYDDSTKSTKGSKIKNPKASSLAAQSSVQQVVQ